VPTTRLWCNGKCSAGHRRESAAQTLLYSPQLSAVSALAVEEHFYLLFPVLLLAFRRRIDHLFWVLSAFCVAVAAWRFFLVYRFGVDAMAFPRIYAGTDTRLDSIAYGCLLSIAFHRAPVYPGVRAADRRADLAPRLQPGVRSQKSPKSPLKRSNKR
jgi:peptidoglycan/LPS O-acetylase OafA/YrhL